MLKRLFAGQMGLTAMALSLGLPSGLPHDLHTSWDATTRNGPGTCFRHLEKEDPYLTAFTNPCSP